MSYYYGKWLQLYAHINCLESEGTITTDTAEAMRELLSSIKLPIEESDEKRLDKTE